MLIAFCGIDGSGKTTQLSMLESECNKERVFRTKQPTDFYRNYDRFMQFTNHEITKTDLLIKELALIAACDKLRHYQMEIEPIVKNSIVLSDRYVFSTYAYFYARGLHDIEWLKEINRFLPLPDVTFYIDVEPEMALSRVKARDGEKMNEEEKNLEILKRARVAFKDEIWGHKDEYYIINGNQSAEKVHIDIMEILRGKI